MLSPTALVTTASTLSRTSSPVKPSTKAAKAAFAAITERKNILLVIARAEDVVALSARNLENVHVLYADQLNTYDVLVSDDVVFTKAAFDAFVAAAQKKEGAK